MMQTICEIASISPLSVQGHTYWIANMYWDTTLPEFKEFEDWCEEKRIHLESVYKISRIPKWELFTFQVHGEKAAIELKMRWS